MSANNTATVFFGKQNYTAMDIPADFRSRHTIPMGYLDELKELRKRRGLSQSALAEMVGVEQPTIQRWESGKRAPDLDDLSALAKALQTTPGALLDGSTLVEAGPRLQVKGAVAAGVWLPAYEWPEDERQTFTGRADVTAKIDHRFGLRVSGDSMDEVYPPGTIIECVSLFGRAEAMSGKRVVIVRVNDDMQYEATVKELVEKDGEVWAIPRSRNPSHMPIRLDVPEPGIVETRVVAVVVASIRPE